MRVRTVYIWHKTPGGSTDFVTVQLLFCVLRNYNYTAQLSSPFRSRSNLSHSSGMLSNFSSKSSCSTPSEAVHLVGLAPRCCEAK